MRGPPHPLPQSPKQKTNNNIQASDFLLPLQTPERHPDKRTDPPPERACKTFNSIHFGPFRAAPGEFWGVGWGRGGVGERGLNRSVGEMKISLIQMSTKAVWITTLHSSQDWPRLLGIASQEDSP